MGVLWFAAKSTMAGSIIYYTTKEGLWSNSDDSIKFYGKLCDTLSWYSKDNIPTDVVNMIPRLPSNCDISTYTTATWNQSIITSMQFLSELFVPGSITNGATRLSKTIMEYIETKDVPNKPQ